MTYPDQEQNPAGLAQKLIREPSVHFLLIAGLLFLLYSLQSSRENVLEIAASDIEARLMLQEMNSDRPLSEAQRDALTRAYIEEQILVREALAMNLDDDARIHDLLAQKMRHVLSGELIQPSQSQLTQFYESNRSRYRIPATLDVDELVFDSREPLPAETLAALEAGAEPERLLALAAGSLATLAGVSRQDLQNIFSGEFAASVFAAGTGQWRGPFVSNRGQHWLRIQNRSAAKEPEMAAIIDQLRLDWIAQEEEALLRQEVARLWENYSIRITGAEQQE